MTTNFRGQTATTPTIGSPRWAGDALTRQYLVPGGAKIDNTAFGAADAYGFITVPSGTVVGRTIAERNAGSPLGPAADTDVDIYIVAFDVTNSLTNDDVELARPYAGLIVKENFLPTALSSLSATIQAAIRARYACTVGVS